MHIIREGKGPRLLKCRGLSRSEKGESTLVSDTVFVFKEKDCGLPQFRDMLVSSASSDRR